MKKKDTIQDIWDRAKEKDKDYFIRDIEERNEKERYI